MLLYKDIQHVTVLIDRSPKVMALAVDRHEDFVHIPYITEVPTPAPKFIDILLTKLQTPLANCLLRDHDTPSGQDFFDIAEAQCKAEVQPVGSIYRIDPKRIAVDGSDE